MKLYQLGYQASFKFPKLHFLGFDKIFFTYYAANNDAESDFTKGNDDFICLLIDNVIYEILKNKKYEKQFKENKNILTFSLFTKYFNEKVQIPIKINLNEKKVTLVTLINNLTEERFNRLSSTYSFYDKKGNLNFGGINIMQPIDETIPHIVFRNVLKNYIW